MARKSLKDAVTKPDAAKAVEVAKKLTGAAAKDDSGEDLYETVSYNLPVELIDLVRDLAEARVRVARQEQRAAKRQGGKGPEARKSASAVVREALESHRKEIEAELARLG